MMILLNLLSLNSEFVDKFLEVKYLQERKIITPTNDVVNGN